MCSVVTNLVTSLEFQPIRCATTLFHFGRTRDVYVATRIILFSSTAEGSATSDYVAATDAPDKVRPELIETWKGLGYMPSFFQTVFLIDAACNHKSFCIVNLISPYLRLFFHLYYSIYSLYGKIFHLLFMFLFIISARE